jgi:hypothetical protein
MATTDTFDDLLLKIFKKPEGWDKEKAQEYWNQISLAGGPIKQERWRPEGAPELYPYMSESTDDNNEAIRKEKQFYKDLWLKGFVNYQPYTSEYLNNGKPYANQYLDNGKYLDNMERQGQRERMAQLIQAFREAKAIRNKYTIVPKAKPTLFFVFDRKVYNNGGTLVRGVEKYPDTDRGKILKALDDHYVSQAEYKLENIRTNIRNMRDRDEAKVRNEFVLYYEYLSNPSKVPYPYSNKYVTMTTYGTAWKRCDDLYAGRWTKEDYKIFHPTIYSYSGYGEWELKGEQLKQQYLKQLPLYLKDVVGLGDTYVRRVKRRKVAKSVIPGTPMNEEQKVAEPLNVSDEQIRKEIEDLLNVLDVSDDKKKNEAKGGV